MTNEDGVGLGHLQRRNLQSPGAARRAYRERATDSARIIPTPKCWCTATKQWGAEGLAKRLSRRLCASLFGTGAPRLTLVRDRIGVKPLYFAWGRDCIAFASEIKALLELPWLERDVDPMAMYHYLSFLTTPAPMTMFRGIYKLPAGYLLQVTRRGGQRAALLGRRARAGSSPPRRLPGWMIAARERFYVDGITSAPARRRWPAHDVGRAVRRIPLRRHRLLHQRRADGAVHGPARSTRSRSDFATTPT